MFFATCERRLEFTPARIRRFHVVGWLSLFQEMPRGVGRVGSDLAHGGYNSWAPVRVSGSVTLVVQMNGVSLAFCHRRHRSHRHQGAAEYVAKERAKKLPQRCRSVQFTALPDGLHRVRVLPLYQLAFRSQAIPNFHVCVLFLLGPALIAIASVFP